MKKILIGASCFLVCLAFTLNVNAWGLGHFDSPGKQYVQQQEFTGNFTHGLQGIYKYTQGEMNVSIKSYKSIPIFGWTQIGNTKACNFKTGIGDVISGPCEGTISNTSTRNIQTKWTQGSAAGYVVADLYTR